MEWSTQTLTRSPCLPLSLQVSFLTPPPYTLCLLSTQFSAVVSGPIVFNGGPPYGTEQINLGITNVLSTVKVFWMPDNQKLTKNLMYHESKMISTVLSSVRSHGFSVTLDLHAQHAHTLHSACHSVLSQLPGTSQLRSKAMCPMNFKAFCSYAHNLIVSPLYACTNWHIFCNRV